MSEEFDPIDPTTEMLVNELSSRILPPLEKTLSNMITQVNAAENNEQDIKGAQNILIDDAVKKLAGAIKTSSDETRAGYEVLMRAVNSIREDVYAIKRSSADDKPEKIDPAQDFERLFNSLNALENSINDFYIEWQEKNKIKQAEEPEQKNFTPDQIQNNTPELNENNIKLDELLKKALPDLENVIRSHDNAQTHELEALSDGLRSLQNNNNAALIHELKNIIADEISLSTENLKREIKNELNNYQTGLKKLTRVIIISAGVSCFVMSLLILLTRI